MNNELFKPENNFSRLGKFFCKKKFTFIQAKRAFVEYTKVIIK